MTCNSDKLIQQILRIRVFFDLISEPTVIYFVAGLDRLKQSNLMLNPSDAQ